MTIAAAIPVILPFLQRILDRAIPDPTARAEAEAALQAAVAEGDAREIEALAGIVQSEVQGESTIQRVWRPITMLVFLALVVWIAVFAPILGLQDESVEALSGVPANLWYLLMLGMGGYIGGRSAEKIVGVLTKG